MIELAQEKIFRDMTTKILVLEQKSTYLEKLVNDMIEFNRETYNLINTITDLLVDKNVLESLEIKEDMIRRYKEQLLLREKRTLDLYKKIQEETLKNDSKVASC